MIIEISSAAYTIDYNALLNNQIEINELMLLVSAPIGGCVITLPPIVNSMSEKFKIKIIDVGLNASTRNITLAPNGADLINGANAGVILNIDHNYIMAYVLPQANYWIAESDCF